MADVRWLALTGALALVLAGCAAPPDQGAAEQAGVAFAGQTGAAACDLLAPATRQGLEKDQGPCAESLAKAHPGGAAGAVRRAEVDGHSAFVEFEHDTLFLALFDDGWKVVAAGCQPATNPGEPYECEVSP